MIEGEKKVPTIPLAELVPGHVYVVRARNFSVAVYCGGFVFVGIRTKFGARYLDAEYHYDQGPPFGTTLVFRDLGVVVPDGVRLGTNVDDVTRCRDCGAAVRWTGPPSPAPWVHVDGAGCGVADVFARGPAENRALFEFLDGLPPLETWP